MPASILSRNRALAEASDASGPSRRNSSGLRIPLSRLSLPDASRAYSAGETCQGLEPGQRPRLGLPLAPDLRGEGKFMGRGRWPARPVEARRIRWPNVSSRAGDSPMPIMTRPSTPIVPSTSSAPGTSLAYITIGARLAVLAGTSYFFFDGESSRLIGYLRAS